MMPCRRLMGAISTICALVAASYAWAGDFTVDVSRLYYQDNAGREIDYDFATGTMVGDDLLIPPSAVIQRPPAESATQYVWSPVYGDIATGYSPGAWTMSIALPEPWTGITVYVTGSAEYEVWGGNTDVSAVGPNDPGYFSVDQKGYQFLGSASATSSFAGSYRYYAIVTLTRIYLDAVQGSDGSYVSACHTGNVIPHSTLYCGPPDGLSAAVGLPEGSHSGGTYKGYVVAIAEPHNEGASVLVPSGPLAPAPDDWVFEATISNFRNVTRENCHFAVAVGALDPTDNFGLQVWAAWFTGVYEGSYYNDALMLCGEVWDDTTGEEWQSEWLLLEGLDPSATTLDLRVEVENGETFAASYSVNAAAWQPLCQYTAVGFTLPGFAEEYPYVALSTGYERGTSPVPDIEEIFIGRRKYHENGIEGPAPWGIAICVEGTGITTASVQDPYGTTHGLEYRDGEWGFEEDGFATLGDLNAAFGPGLYTFTFNGGADEVVIDFNAAAPAGCVGITHPLHGQENVEKEPEYEWTSAAGLGGNLLTAEVREDPDGIDQDIYDVGFSDMNTITWQPGPLQPDEEYALEVGVRNVQGGGEQTLQTDIGSDDFDFWGEFTYWNEITFETAPMPDIQWIGFEVWKVLIDGAPPPNPWCIEIYVEGTDIIGGTVTSPGTAGELTLEDWGYEWGVEREFETEGDLEAAFGDGDYQFHINGGFATVTINYELGEPPLGFANIISPEHGEHKVDPEPTFTWDPVDDPAPFGDSLDLEVSRDPEGDNEDVDAYYTDDMSIVSWQPDPLEDQTEFAFEISIENLHNGGPVLLQTDQDDDFLYEAEFAFVSEVYFDTLHWRVTGDATNDCKVDILDMLHIRNHLGDDPDTGDNWWADVTEDDKIDILDMLHVRNHLNESCPE